MVNYFIFSVAMTTPVLRDQRVHFFCLPVVVTADKVLKVGFHTLTCTLCVFVCVCVRARVRAVTLLRLFHV